MVRRKLLAKTIGRCRLCVGASAVDQVELGEVELRRLADPANSVGVCSDHDRCSFGVYRKPGGLVDHYCGTANLTGCKIRKPACTLLVATTGRDDEGVDDPSHEGNRCAGVTELLADGCQLDHAESLAAVGFRGGDSRPAEFTDLLPESFVVGAGLGCFAHIFELAA